MDVFFLLLALSGHAFLWIGLVNRLHALNIHRRTLCFVTFAYFLCAALIPIGIGCYCFSHPVRLANTPWSLAADRTPAGLLVSAYFVACWLVAPVTLLRFVWFAVFRRQSPLLRFHRRRRRGDRSGFRGGQPGRTRPSPAGSPAVERKCYSSK